MNRSGLLSATAIAVGLAFSVGAMAEIPTDTQATASAEARKKADARRDADSAKRDADYAAAKEKCNVFAGDVKTNCVNNAKARFDKK